MKLYSESKDYKLYQGSMLDMLEVIEPNSIDSIVCDPPYELNFMGKGWDNSGIAFQPNTWKKCYEVLKPGGYLLAFGGSRTFHRIACAIEDAGFEIRNTIMWLYGSGFPKSQNIGKMYDKKMGNEREIVGETKIGKTSLGDGSGWDTSQNMKDLKATGKLDITKGTSKFEGWGSALKPSYEPIIVARKPFKGSLVDNVIENGVGGINIDECRVGTEIITQLQKDMKPYNNNKMGVGYSTQMTGITTQTIGRFPANTILTYDEEEFDTESWLRYFYCAKASKKDRDEGLDTFNQEKVNDGRQTPIDNAFQRGETLRKNTHPTVKPTELMQYLVRLVSPDGATILDPFNGSGSTGKAVMYENKERNKNYKYIGIELTEEYLPIAKARIEYICNLKKEEVKEMQMSIFDLGESNE
jgi:site-specific DNA-methyltransferase (adenine-specific)